MGTKFKEVNTLSFIGHIGWPMNISSAPDGRDSESRDLVSFK
jgi:hypothetical protein